MTDRRVKQVIDNTPEPSWSEYFARRARTGAPLHLRKRPCDDCAVVWGMYAPVTDELARESFGTRVACARRWFCHQTPTMACRGNCNRLGLDVVAAVLKEEAEDD